MARAEGVPGGVPPEHQCTRLCVQTGCAWQRLDAPLRPPWYKQNLCHAINVVGAASVNERCDFLYCSLRSLAQRRTFEWHAELKAQQFGAKPGASSDCYGGLCAAIFVQRGAGPVRASHRHQPAEPERDIKTSTSRGSHHYNAPNMGAKLAYIGVWHLT